MRSRLIFAFFPNKKKTMPETFCSNYTVSVTSPKLRMMRRNPQGICNPILQANNYFSRIALQTTLWTGWAIHYQQDLSQQTKPFLSRLQSCWIFYSLSKHDRYKITTDLKKEAITPLINKIIFTLRTVRMLNNNDQQ